MALQGLAVAGAKMAGSAVGQVAIQLALEKAVFKKDVENTTKSTESAFAKSFDNVEKKGNKTFSGIGSVIKTAFTVVATGAVASFTKSAVNAASETQAAWTGLNSIVSGTGKSFSEAQGFLEDYISDGLIPLTDAITAYKNLAARGYSTEQIEGTLTALKDAAAFGRQASYSYGEAIKSATEGLKNENSILVDNAGVTKNVAKMWDDYAKSIGTTANNLTQQQKIQAEVNGIMEETKFQVGDAAAYADTFSGRIAKINTAFYNFKVAVGKFVAPIAQIFLPYIELALNALTRFFNKMAQVLKVFGLEMPDVVSKASTNIASIGSSASGTADNIASTGDAATQAAKKIKRAFAGVDEINVLNNKEETSDGSGGSSGGGVGSIGGIGDASFSDAIEVGGLTESLDSGAVKIANKIKELFAPLKDIDFTNLSNAFERLKDAIAPLTEKFFSGLEWLWYNILVPFATWTIEDVMPAFFDILSGALEIVNKAIEDLQPVFSWFWDKVLEPLAKWTGGIIVDVLTAMGDALEKISKSETAMAILEGVALTIGGIAVAVGAFNIAMTAGSIAVGAFGVAMGILTSPITLTIAAIGALVGGIILLAKHWDDVKEIASLCWTKILEVWSTAKDWINTNVVQPIGNVFSTLISKGTQIGSNLIGGIRDGLTKAKDKVVEKWNEVKGWFSNITKEAKVQINQKWADIKDKWVNLTKNVKNKTADMKASVATKWGDIKKKWTDITSNIKDKTASMKAKIGSTWAGLRTQWQNLMANFKDKTITIKTKIGEVVGNLKSTINDNIIAPINKKLPSIFPKIPYLAQGGWVQANNPRLAVIGDNKTEPEIVSPESKIKEQVIKGIKEMGATNTNQKIDLTIKLEYPDGKYLIKEINNTQIRDGKISLLV